MARALCRAHSQHRLDLHRRLRALRRGESPAALVRRLRIDEARRLLEETALPLKEITARTGIGDESTFWRVFTRRLGVTPAAYRERFRISAPG